MRNTSPIKRIRHQVSYPTTGRATVKEACDFLRLSRSRIYEMKDEGTLPSFTDGGKRFFMWEDLWAHHESVKSAQLV